MKNEKALRGERGRTFADKLMNAMSRVNTNIPRPKLWTDDRQEYYPLSVILMDREVEFVEENESEDLPRGLDVDTSREVYQFSEANGESRVARRIREGDIPMDYLRMLASQIVQNTDKVKGDKEPEKAVLLSAAPNDYAMGTPAKAKSGTAFAGSTQQQLFSKASTPPQTIKVSLDVPRTIDYSEVLNTVQDLRKLEWVRNPYFVSPRDWTHALGLGVMVLKAILHPEDLGFMDNLREETFWKNLLPLIQGKVFSPKDRVREIMVELTGNATGMSRPIQPSHARLQGVHDLPRYLDYMKQKYDEMEEVEGDRQLDRSKMDQDEFLMHIVSHVKPFLPKVENQYEQFLHDEVNPFGLAMIWKGVTLMERHGKISRKLGSTFTTDADGRSVGLHRMRTEQTRKGAQKAETDRPQMANVHDPTSFFERSFQDGAGASLRSGLNYDAVEHGENFNAQRNLAPTSHGSFREGADKVANIRRAAFDQGADRDRRLSSSQDRGRSRGRSESQDRDRGRERYDSRGRTDRGRDTRDGDRFRSRSRSEVYFTLYL